MYLKGDGLARVHVADINDVSLRKAYVVIKEYLQGVVVAGVEQQQLARA